MLSHLRAQNRAVEKGVKNVNTYLKKLAGGVQLDERGRCRVQYNNVGVHVVTQADRNLIIFKSFINFLPDPASGKLLPLYYHLLDMNDEPATGLAYFAIVAGEELDTNGDVISVETKRPVVDISEEEFRNCLQSVGEVANMWMKKLTEEFEAPPVP